MIVSQYALLRFRLTLRLLTFPFRGCAAENDESPYSDTDRCDTIQYNRQGDPPFSPVSEHLHVNGVAVRDCIENVVCCLTKNCYIFGTGRGGVIPHIFRHGRQD